jgi:precorrin-2 C(20)-methyltransferase
MGTFWAIGVGPGDPGLLTLKAMDILRRVQVIYHAGPRPDQGRAWSIVRSYLRPDQEVRVVLAGSAGILPARGAGETPALPGSRMASLPSDGKTPYRSAVDQIAAECRAGREVALVTEGDPTLYSTAANVWQLLEELHPDIPVEIVPGVSSITAGAARVGWPLAQKDEALAVVPASYHPQQLAKILNDFPSVCLLKVSQVLPQVLSFLESDGEDRQAVYVENLGTDQEWTTTNLREAVGRREYFSQVLIRRKKRTPSQVVAGFPHLVLGAPNVVAGSPYPATEWHGPETVPQRGEAAHHTNLPLVLNKLWIIGLGPGDPDLLTRRALEVLRQAEVIVGYEAYLAWLSPLNLRAELRGSPIGKEKERAFEALELARAGKRVALVSSGDAGVYGMSSVLLEAVEVWEQTQPVQEQPAPSANCPSDSSKMCVSPEEFDPSRQLSQLAERRVQNDQPPAQGGIDTAQVEIEVIPGVTAATAAAALLGAPLGHDFACISLSDLLTPWDVIERHLYAASQGDLVLALYNPASRERTWQLPRAREILLQHRRPDTPVGLVDRAYRTGTRVVQTTLGDLTADGIGMETIVIIGNSQTRVINGRMVTPRGYDTSAWMARPEPSKGVEPSQSIHALRKASGRATHAGLGRKIMAESFAIIERELGPHDFLPWALAVVRRMIHASADFDFAITLRYSTDFKEAIEAAFRDRAPVITDTEMVLAGIRTALSNSVGALLLSPPFRGSAQGHRDGREGVSALKNQGGAPEIDAVCLINEPSTLALAQSSGLTGSAAGIRLAAERFERPILVIGNAPTALNEALRLVTEGWRPRAIIGVPVGFVGVEEAKQRLLDQSIVPYLTCVGRKGGSAVAAAAVNALVEWFKS